ncbi:MAG: nitrous oxide reductase accessory protein NosL [Sandaracinaceae bacterium]
MKQAIRTFLVVLVLAACSGGEDTASSTTRCDLCGMVVAEDSGWRAGGTGADRETLAFDTPKCLFRHRHERGAVHAPWVIEYDSQDRQDASGLFYVLGSDIEGPMGRDLVPLASRTRATGFMQDHAGTEVLAFDEVTAEVTSALFQPRR